jgi:DNA-binding MarR family transcriptional regulator
MADSPRTRPKLDFGALSGFIGFHLRTAQLTVYDNFMRNAPVRGLTPGQLAILVFIAQNASLTQQRLCDGIGVEKSTLVVRLHRLAERGLIKRVRSTADRRENCLELTPAGHKALQAMLTFVVKHERQIGARLTAAERKQLIVLLSKIG